MQRRTFVGAATMTALGLAGCSGGTETPSDTTSGDDASAEQRIVSLLERHWDAYRNRNVEEYVSTFHTDSPMRDSAPWENEQHWGQDDSTFVIEERTIVEQTDTTATVHEVVRGEVNGNTSRWRSIDELRTEDGDWKMWNYTEEQIDSSS